VFYGNTPYVLFIYESVRVKNRKRSAHFAPESGEDQLVTRDHADRPRNTKDKHTKQ